MTPSSQTLRKECRTHFVIQVISGDPGIYAPNERTTGSPVVRSREFGTQASSRKCEVEAGRTDSRDVTDPCDRPRRIEHAYLCQFLLSLKRFEGDDMNRMPHEDRDVEVSKPADAM